MLHPVDVVAVFSDGVTDARNLREELYESRDKRRLFRKLADTSGGPETIGRALLQDIREFSAGHTQVDDITLICFGPVGR
jgi:phosphoserine phosphatase RsbU/P